MPYKPLRSVDQPDALDKLSGMDKYKVEMANQLYDAVLQITKCAVELYMCGDRKPMKSLVIKGIHSMLVHMEALGTS